MAIRPKTVVTLKMEGTAATHARTEIDIGEHRVIVDEPAARGGTGLAPTPTETMIASLVACTNVISHKIAHANGVEFQEMHIRAEAQLDRRGVTLEEDIAVPFPRIDLYIDVKSDSDPEKIKIVSRDLQKFCAVSKVFREAGSEVNEIWTVNGEKR